MAAPLIAVAGKILTKVTAQVAIKAGMSAASNKSVRNTLIAIVAVLLVLPLAGLVGIAVLASSMASIGGANEAAVQSRCVGDPISNVPDTGGSIDTLSSAQRANAITIIGVIKTAWLLPGSDNITLEIQQRAAVIALATAMQESRLTNLTGGDRDSLGLFQQRPLMAWGSKEQILDTTYSTSAFLYGAGTNKGLVDVRDWQTMEVTVAAQAVQRSGYPNAYAQWEQLGTDIVDALWSTSTPVPIHPALDRPGLKDNDLPTGGLIIPAGDTTCDGPSDEYPTYTGAYIKPTSWGGYANGDVPLSAMCVIPWAPTHVARCDGVQQLIKLNEAYKADHEGRNLGITSSYRNLDRQKSLKAEYCATGRCHLAAEPGTSNHGWGLALDLANFGSVGQYDKPNYHWMMANGPTYGWVHPPFMQKGGSGPLEPWHWEFMGAPPGTSAATENVQ